MPLVSMVVITYNSAETVLETLESIKNQTYSNLELIITDDCSSDKTVDICKAWINENISRFKRVEMVTSPINTGVSANINRGMFKAQGKWIKGSAGDDLLIPSAVEEFVNFAENGTDDIRICVSDVEVFSSREVVPSNIREMYKNFFELEKEPYDLQRKRVMYQLVFVGPGFFFRRDLFEEIGGYSEKYGNAEEWPFVYKIITNGNRIYALDKKLILYRYQPNTLSRKRDDKGLIDKKLFMGTYRHFFDHPFKDLIKERHYLTAWHYALYYWSCRLQYKIDNNKERRLIRHFFSLFSPLAYIKKIKSIYNSYAK